MPSETATPQLQHGSQPAAGPDAPERWTCARVYRGNAEIHVMPWTGDAPGTVAAYVSRAAGECVPVSVPFCVAVWLTSEHRTEVVELVDSPAWAILPKGLIQA